jgi:hypothetical protein
MSGSASSQAWVPAAGGVAVYAGTLLLSRALRIEQVAGLSWKRRDAWTDWAQQTPYLLAVEVLAAAIVVMGLVSLWVVRVELRESDRLARRTYGAFCVGALLPLFLIGAGQVELAEPVLGSARNVLQNIAPRALELHHWMLGALYTACLWALVSVSILTGNGAAGSPEHAGRNLERLRVLLYVASCTLAAGVFYTAALAAWPSAYVQDAGSSFQPLVQAAAWREGVRSSLVLAAVFGPADYVLRSHARATEPYSVDSREVRRSTTPPASLVSEVPRVLSLLSPALTAALTVLLKM